MFGCYFLYSVPALFLFFICFVFKLHVTKQEGRVNKNLMRSVIVCGQS